MGLCTQQHHVLEMSMVDVSIHSEQPFENNFDDVHKVLWERNSNSTWKNLFVVKLVFYPGHQEINVLTSTDLERCLNIMTISPQVLILWSCTHGWTTLLSTEFHEYTIKYVYFIVKLNSIDCQPFIQIFTSWQLYSKLHITTSKGHSSYLF